jgi:hypothetical protein
MDGQDHAESAYIHDDTEGRRFLDFFVSAGCSTWATGIRP